jgi:uncharacterized protein
MTTGRILSGEHMLARIFVRANERWRHLVLYRALVERLLKEGFAGATVLRGLEGFGVRSHLLDQDGDLPVIVEVIDTEEHIRRLLAILDEMVEGCVLVTVEKVCVMRYGQGWPGEPSTP